MTKSSDIKETSSYDNCIDEKEIVQGTLEQFIEIETVDDHGDNPDHWKKHWVGMPEFEQKENPTFKTIYIHFRNKEDFDKFCSDYQNTVDNDQRITEKTKSLWYPHLNRDENALLRWIEE